MDKDFEYHIHEIIKRQDETRNCTSTKPMVYGDSVKHRTLNTLCPDLLKRGKAVRGTS